MREDLAALQRRQALGPDSKDKSQKSGISPYTGALAGTCDLRQENFLLSAQYLNGFFPLGIRTGGTAPSFHAMNAGHCKFLSTRQGVAQERKAMQCKGGSAQSRQISQSPALSRVVLLPLGPQAGAGVRRWGAHQWVNLIFGTPFSMHLIASQVVLR